MPHSGQYPIIVQFDEIRLLGTLFLGKGDEPKPTAILLHGIPGIEKNYDLALTLRDNGWNALIFHYRGSWGSSGAYNLHTIPEDVRAVLDRLTDGTIEQVDSERLVLFGHSLGGWAALLSATADDRVRAVAVVAGVSIPETFRLADPEYAAGYTPWLTGITAEELASQWKRLPKSLFPLKQIHRLSRRPLLVLHSATDDVVPVVNGRMLAEAAGPSCRYIEHPDANHSFTWHRPWLLKTVLDWLNETALNTEMQ